MQNKLPPEFEIARQRAEARVWLELAFPDCNWSIDPFHQTWMAAIDDGTYQRAAIGANPMTAARLAIARMAGLA